MQEYSMTAIDLTLSFPMDYISEGTLFSVLKDQQTCLYMLLKPNQCFLI